MSIWNCAHNVGGALIGPMAAGGLVWFGSWQAGTFWFPAVVALIIVVIAYSLIRDTPQSCGLPPIEEYRNDYPKNYSAKSEVELTAKEIFFKYVLNNKTLWFIALANAFIYLIRYGVLDWAPTYLKEVKGYDITEIGWVPMNYLPSISATKSRMARRANWNPTHARQKTTTKTALITCALQPASPPSECS